nr:MAG TPA: hypothetical protein [Caudoviricetes sp.]
MPGFFLPGNRQGQSLTPFASHPIPSGCGARGRQVRPRRRSRGVMYARQTAGSRSIRHGPLPLRERKSPRGNVGEAKQLQGKDTP